MRKHEYSFLFFFNSFKQKNLFTSSASSASVFDYILLSITNEKTILSLLYDGSEISLVPNQVLSPFSKYSWSCAFTAKSWNRIVLSTSLLNNLASLGCSPCLLTFLSHHIL